jgi:hypothetical protein
MLSWVSVNANTGSIIADLPTLVAGGPLRQTLMRYETQTARLPTWDPADPEGQPPPNWVEATRKGAVFLVALSEPQPDEPRGLPLWGGLVVRRTRVVPAGGVSLTLVTAEGYFDRVYVGDHVYTEEPQHLLFEDLIDTYAKTGAKRGLPIRVEILGGNGAPRDHTYTDSSDKTLYAVLGALSGLLGGPEWTVRWEWVDDQKLGLVVTVSDRIGSPPPAGLGPGAQFYLPGAVTSAQLVEGYGTNEGANDIMAVSSGVEDARPQSPHQVNDTDLRPRFEHRWTPSTDIKEIDTLVSHAQRALASMKDGTLALTISADRAEAPALNRDWSIGDDIGFDITAPEFPQGLRGVARCVGWELDDNTVTPLVDVSNIEGVEQ